MKKNFNIIQINGFRGILMTIGIVSCLFAGFGIFPGIVMKSIWNLLSIHTGVVPQIAIWQGVMLWGITVVSYFAFKKNKMIIEFKSTNDLSHDEMEEVMQRIRLQRQTDLITKAMMNAKMEFDKQNSINSEVESESNSIEELEKNNIDI